MSYFDIHTHRSAEFAIRSCSRKDALPVDAAGYRSVGIHPWFLENVEEQLHWLIGAVHSPEVLAIGECGLDKFASASMQEQTAVFQKCVELSEARSLPLVIHAVRCSNEVIRIKKDRNPKMPWIIHGFRGKKEVAKEFLRHGFYLSFGEKFQPDALLSTPCDRLFLETDESSLPIEDVYRKVADIRIQPIEELATQVWNNVQNVFFRR